MRTPAYFLAQAPAWSLVYQELLGGRSVQPLATFVVGSTKAAASPASLLGTGGKPGWVQLAEPDLHVPVPGRRGGRYHSLLTVEQEVSLMAAVADRARAGDCVTWKDLHAQVSNMVGRKVGEKPIFSMLARHGWRWVGCKPAYRRRGLRQRPSVPACPT